MRGTIGLRLAIACALVLAPAVAFADDNNVTIGKNGSGELLVTVNGAAANVHFTFTPSGCGSEVPCYEFTAGTGMVGVPIEAGGDCQTQNDEGQGAAQCPAAGVTAITFVFKNGGGWAAYEGGGGLHARGPCSPAPVTVETGPNGPAVSVFAWNGCPETVICNSRAGVFTGVEVDAMDVVRGTCSSVIRH